MAQTSGKTNDLHYRLFAKLLMFITLFLGMALGYTGGFVMGQQNALVLLYQGQQAADTVAADEEEDGLLNTAVADCYKEIFGATRYSQIAAGQSLTTAETVQVRSCEELDDN